jgi:hypothetical protein
MFSVFIFGSFAFAPMFATAPILAYKTVARFTFIVQTHDMGIVVRLDGVATTTGLSRIHRYQRVSRFLSALGGVEVLFLRKPSISSALHAFSLKEGVGSVSIGGGDQDIGVIGSNADSSSDLFRL